MGKLIYQTKGKAREYCPWACNIYNGCSNRCTYCYNRKGIAADRLGKDVPELKKGFYIENEDGKDDRHTEDEKGLDLTKTFIKELKRYKNDILNDGKGLHFNFVSDPCLPETYDANLKCIIAALENGVDVQILTKMADWPIYDGWEELLACGDRYREHIKFGFTLTGMDKMEPGASMNAARIGCMFYLANRGFYTWASIEPVIDLNRSYDMIELSLDDCKEYRIGLLSGKKEYSPEDVVRFRNDVEELLHRKDWKGTLVWKESVMKYITGLEEGKEVRYE